ncbi:MAG: TlpA family protein disulfide reductase [Rhodospirillaceae bacterium]|nr:TlpA family protein disulfide reductase [Rhodospirillaceae bacterium]
MLKATAGLVPQPDAGVEAPPPARKTPADFTVIDPAQPAPATPFSDESGRSLTLAAFRGRVVLLNLWATWCGPCVDEMPALDRLQAAVGGPDFTVVALSEDRQGISVIKPFYEKEAIGHLAIAVDDGGALARDLDVQGLPTSFLIDREGRLIGRLTGPADWDSAEWTALVKRAVAGQPVAGGS